MQDMGLGKTLTFISLLLHQREFSTEYSKTSLVVCPLSIIDNWVSQIEEHVAPDVLSYYVAHGPNRDMRKSNLEQFDLVITTYNVLGLYSAQRPPRDSFMKMKWRRVVLDEGHLIRNKNTQQSRTAFELEAAARFVISGTPLQNALSDLYCLVKFLRFGVLGILFLSPHS